jgi:hypothetical protein
VHLVVPPGGSFRETRKIELGPRPLTIGRGEGCDVRVDVPGVDDEHARISEVALVAIGPDCAIGDVPLDAGSRRLVMPGDEVQIGSVVIALEGDDPSLLPPPPEDVQGVGDPRFDGPRVRVVEGANFGDELLLGAEGRQYVIGRAETCDLVLEDREVSREHVKLVRRGYSVFIQDQSSTRGSWLGRATVYPGATIEWSRPRMLKVGATVLSLELPDAIRRAAPPAQASAPMTPAPRTRPGHGPSSKGSSEPSSPEPTPPPGSGAAPPVSPRASHPNSGVPSATPSGALVPPMAPPPESSSPAASVPHARTPPPISGDGLKAPTRRAWKKSAPTIGKVSGLLLLALCGLAIAGGLFVVFSLLE